MANKNSVSIKLQILREQWKYYLPPETKTIMCFKDPLDMFFEGPEEDGVPPDDVDHSVKVFIDKPEKWQDLNITAGLFREVWPDILEWINGLQTASTSLVYFASLTSSTDLLSSVIPYLSFDDRDKSRFYISEIYRDVITDNQSKGYACFEYSYSSFKEFTAPSGLDYSPGRILIMGINVRRDKADRFLRVNIQSKETLEDILKDEYVYCWWVCDSDLEGMTIWHKNYSAKQLSDSICKKVLGRLNCPINKDGFDKQEK